MKFTIVSIVFVITQSLTFFQLCSAATPVISTVTIQDNSTAQGLFAQVVRGSNDLRTLELIQAKGLQPTQANVQALQTLLARGKDPEAVVDLIRLLGSLYTPQNLSGKNDAIAVSVKGKIFSVDRKVALAAVQTYARLGFQPDVIELLDFSLKNKIIDEDSYCQELALGLAVYPASAQFEAASRLATASNNFGAEVLALTLANKKIVGSVSDSARRILLGYLERKEPKMPFAIGQYGINDGGRYAEWLETVALLSDATGQMPYTQVIFSRLNDDKTDPRKLIGYLTSPEGKRFVRENGATSALNGAVAKAVGFAKQFPGHPVFTPMLQDIVTTMGPSRE